VLCRYRLPLFRRFNLPACVSAAAAAAAAVPAAVPQVLNLRGVSSTPTVLESTSLLFCYGTDLLFTRINPAAHFDSLASDFSYGLLVVALLALLVGTLVLQRTSRQSMLKAKWE
jgi:hypothetical protein